MKQDSVKLEAISSNDRADIQTLISNWLTRLHDAQIGHYTCSEKLYNKANMTGYALILSSTVVTAMLFMNAEGLLKMFLVMMSIISATLSGVVSFARFAEKAEQHRAAASCYGKLRRQLDKLNCTKLNPDSEELNKQLKILRIEWEYTSRNAPLTPFSAIKSKSKVNS